jgi:hypothetical protein
MLRPSLLDLIPDPDAPLELDEGASHVLRKLAWARAYGGAEKAAVVSAGQMPDPAMAGGDPAAAGGAPPPDPAAGGAAAPATGAPDPQMMQQMMQMMQSMGGGAGGAGGMLGKGGKKAEQAITDAKLFALDVKLTAIMNHLKIPMPPEATLGAPPDPMAQQAAGQDHALASGVASNPDSSAQPAGGPPAGPDPMQPMDPSQGPIGKTAALWEDDDDVAIGDAWSGVTGPAALSAYDQVMADAGAVLSQAARLRQHLGA